MKHFFWKLYHQLSYCFIDRFVEFTVRVVHVKPIYAVSPMASLPHYLKHNDVSIASTCHSNVNCETSNTSSSDLLEIRDGSRIVGGCGVVDFSSSHVQCSEQTIIKIKMKTSPKLMDRIRLIIKVPYREGDLGENSVLPFDPRATPKLESLPFYLVAIL
jgi:hypothetical protein